MTATALATPPGGTATLQSAYNASGAAPHIVVTAAGGGVSIRDNATPVAPIFRVQNNSPADLFSVSATQVVTSIAGVQVARAYANRFDIGRSTRRVLSVNDDVTGYPSMEYLPDGATRTTLTGGAMLSWASTVTSNIPGGGGLGNDNAPAAISWTGTCVFADQGFLLASGLLVNAATKVQAQANVGPLYLFLDQYNTFADGGSFTCSQHNALRIQPSWGPNINAGSITQVSAVYILNNCSVNATVGTASITTLTYWEATNPSLVAGGTIGTFNGLNFANITTPTTIRGINSAMSSGDFIRHAGTAPARFGGSVFLGAGATWDVELSRGAANRLDLATGDAMRIINGSLQFVDTGGQIASSVSGEVQVTSTRLGYGVAPAGANWAFAFNATVRTITVGGDYQNCLNTTGGNHTINAALSTFTQWTINAPAGTIGTGSVVTAANVIIQTSVSIGTNRYGLLCSANPSGGTLNYCARFSGAAGVRIDGVFYHTGSTLGLYSATPVVQPSTTGETVGFTAGAGTGVNDDSTFTGNVGATAYRISDVVKALKNTGLMAA